MDVKIWLGNDSGNEGKWDTAANWQPSGVPVSTDIVVFDGNVSTEDVDSATGIDQTGVNLGGMLILPSFTGNIGDNDHGGAGIGPLIIACAGIIRYQGSGNVYIQSGNDAADCVIAHVIADGTGTLGLSSQKNAVAGNVSDIQTVQVLKNTVYIYGAEDVDNTNAEDGCSIDRLLITPTSGRGGNINVYMGENCRDLKNSGNPFLVQFAGTLRSYTEFLQKIIYDGECLELYQ